MQTELVIEEHKDNNAGLTPEEIARIYEDEYRRVSKLTAVAPTFVPVTQTASAVMTATATPPQQPALSSAPISLWLGSLLVVVLIVGGLIWRRGKSG
jgi:hypothetical protein